ncbi:ATP-dependent DNA helicase PIF4-like [Canna indica]|uniref:ATP-dependent DNA helicase n=1 Tax=Canna indica TaxID=4628 RepID=A0AAQ3Q5Z4_9LILI|nr:ATP-dependent DNA helicase PIF4-like [Canna indica]
MTDEGGVFFLYGYGGTGKTYIWKALTSALRSKGHIVLTIVSNEIATILLPGGRMAHSRTLRAILRFQNPNTFNLPFGGIPIVFGGDFRQILPVGNLRVDELHYVVQMGFVQSQLGATFPSQSLPEENCKSDKFSAQT